MLITVAAVAALRELPHELFVAEHSLGHRLCRDGLVEPVPCHQVDHLKHGVHRPADGRSVAAVRPLWQLEIARSLRQSRVGQRIQRDVRLKTFMVEIKNARLAPDEPPVVRRRRCRRRAGRGFS